MRCDAAQSLAPSRERVQSGVAANQVAFCVPFLYSRLSYSIDSARLVVASLRQAQEQNTQFLRSTSRGE